MQPVYLIVLYRSIGVLMLISSFEGVTFVYTGLHYYKGSNEKCAIVTSGSNI
jgi:hypothetical protein